MRFLILIFVSFCLSEDVYPYFSDMSKQLEFEKKKIYIEDKSGQKMNITGGDSYIAMANPLGYLFLEQDADYVAMNNPIRTTYTYWSKFNIIQNNKKLSEIDLLKIIGLKEDANKLM